MSLLSGHRSVPFYSGKAVLQKHASTTYSWVLVVVCDRSVYLLRCYELLTSPQDSQRTFRSLYPIPLLLPS